MITLDLIIITKPKHMVRLLYQALLLVMAFGLYIMMRMPSSTLRKLGMVILISSF